MPLGTKHTTRVVCTQRKPPRAKETARGDRGTGHGAVVMALEGEPQLFGEHGHKRGLERVLCCAVPPVRAQPALGSLQGSDVEMLE